MATQACSNEVWIAYAKDMNVNDLTKFQNNLVSRGIIPPLDTTSTFQVSTIQKNSFTHKSVVLTDDSSKKRFTVEIRTMREGSDNIYFLYMVRFQEGTTKPEDKYKIRTTPRHLTKVAFNVFKKFGTYVLSSNNCAQFADDYCKALK